jgi:hypothetical protein
MDSRDNSYTIYSNTLVPDHAGRKNETFSGDLHVLLQHLAHSYPRRLYDIFR